MNNTITLKKVLYYCVCLPQRLLDAVKKNATRGDPRSVVRAIDHFCRNKEWAMNVGDEKGTDLSYCCLELNKMMSLLSDACFSISFDYFFFLPQAAFLTQW